MHSSSCASGRAGSAVPEQPPPALRNNSKPNVGTESVKMFASHASHAWDRQVTRQKDDATRRPLRHFRADLALNLVIRQLSMGKCGKCGLMMAVAAAYCVLRRLFGPRWLAIGKSCAVSTTRWQLRVVGQGMCCFRFRMVQATCEDACAVQQANGVRRKYKTGFGGCRIRTWCVFFLARNEQATT